MIFLLIDSAKKGKLHSQSKEIKLKQNENRKACKKLTSTFMAKLAKKSLPKSLTLKALPNILAATSVTKEKQAKTSFLFFYRQM